MRHGTQEARRGNGKALKLRAVQVQQQPASSSESGKSTGDGSSVLYSSLLWKASGLIRSVPVCDARMYFPDLFEPEAAAAVKRQRQQAGPSGGGGGRLPRQAAAAHAHVSDDSPPATPGYSGDGSDFGGWQQGGQRGVGRPPRWQAPRAAAAPLLGVSIPLHSSQRRKRSRASRRAVPAAKLAMLVEFLAQQEQEQQQQAAAQQQQQQQQHQQQQQQQEQHQQGAQAAVEMQQPPASPVTAAAQQAVLGGQPAPEQQQHQQHQQHQQPAAGPPQDAPAGPDEAAGADEPPGPDGASDNSDVTCHEGEDGSPLPAVQQPPGDGAAGLWGSGASSDGDSPTLAAAAKQQEQQRDQPAASFKAVPVGCGGAPAADLLKPGQVAGGAC